MAKHPGKCPKCGSRLEFETAVGEQIVCSQCGAALRIPGKAQATDPVDPLLGQKLGQFEILELLGRGGMGAVYKARQPSLDRLVAIKVLPESFSHDAKFAERFQREARAAGAVSHAHIIQVFSVGQDRGFQFIAMEFVGGEALADVLKREGRLPPDRALELLKQTAAALAEAHAIGIIHRDIKPSNILLTSEGVAKVADFGLAKREGVDVSVTQTGTTLGTPLYLPPEAARAEPLDARSDLYSLGATFYHVLAGKPPFEGDTAAALIVKHIEAEVPPLLRAAPDAPPELCKAIHRLLRKRPADRFQSAAELLQALARVGHPAGERAASPLSPRERARGRDAGAREHPAARPSPRRPLSPSEEETQPPPVPAGVSRGEATAAMPQPAHPSPAERRQAARHRTRRLALIAGGSAGLAVLALLLVLVVGRQRHPQATVPLPTEANQGTPTPIPTQPAKAEPSESIAPSADAEGWISLFDGKSLAGWRVPDADLFARHGDVRVENGELRLRKGQQATAATWAGQFPSVDYELAFELSRPSPIVSFPVGTSQWGFFLAKDFTGEGGAGIGPVRVTRSSLSCTARGGFKVPFEEGKWHRIRLRVAIHRITAWVDGQERFEFDTTPHEEQGRGGDATLKPLAVFTWQDDGTIRDIRLRRLKPEPPPDDARWGPWENLFDGKSLDGWTVERLAPASDVKVSDGAIVCTGSSLAHRPIQGKDVILRAKVMREKGGALQMNLWWGQNGYMAVVDEASAVVIGTMAGRSFVPLGKAKPRLPATGFFEMTFAAVGDTLTIQVDGQEVVRAPRDTVREFDRIRLVSWPAGTAHFKDVQAKILGAEAPRPGALKVYAAWPFDAAEARRRQTETAKALGVPVEQDVDLGNGVKMTFVVIPAGEFMMGAVNMTPREMPVHKVTIPRPFLLGKFEVTQEQWQAVMGDNPSGFKGPTRPVEMVSWDDCQDFVKKAREKLGGREFRLPSEAEWEYACRAGSTTGPGFGDDQAGLGDFGWSGLHSGRHTHNVGEKKPNAWGLYDMLGNVWEWCEDVNHLSYGDPPGAPADGSAWVAGGIAGHRILRGGAWDNIPGNLRPANRFEGPAERRGNYSGFRVVLVPGPPKEAQRPPKPPDEARWGPWEDLFDGKTLDGWTVMNPADGGKTGKVEVRDGRVLLEGPNLVKGLMRPKGFPSDNFEVSVEAIRHEPLPGGREAFLNVTFGVGKSVAVLMLGDGASLGVAGGTMKLAQKKAFFRVQDGQWYRIRVSVAAACIRVWVDDLLLFDVPRDGRGGNETAPTWTSFHVAVVAQKAELRSIRLRRLKPEGAQAPAGRWTVYTGWPFDAAEATRRQEETAKALGVGGAQGVDLGSGVKMAFVLIPAGEFLMGSPPRSCRSAARLGLAPGAGWDSLGCRVVLREP